MNEKTQDMIFNAKSGETKSINTNTFFKKITKVFSTAGKQLIEKVLLLWAMLSDEKIPNHVKLTIISAISYFILPFDAIPDFLTGIGFTDDLSILTGSLFMISSHITQAHKDKAKQYSQKFFK